MYEIRIFTEFLGHAAQSVLFPTKCQCFIILSFGLDTIHAFHTAGAKI
jgi:hypothetical protein